MDLSFDLELVGLSEGEEAFRPQLAAQRSSAEVQLAWADAYTGWSVYSLGELGTPELWSKLAAPVISSNGYRQVYLSPTNTAGFYQLRKPEFCSPFQ